jgi:hypothetical protein
MLQSRRRLSFIGAFCGNITVILLAHSKRVRIFHILSRTLERTMMNQYKFDNKFIDGVDICCLLQNFIDLHLLYKMLLIFLHECFSTRSKFSPRTCLEMPEAILGCHDWKIPMTLSGYRPRMPPDNSQCIGNPPQQRFI